MSNETIDYPWEDLLEREPWRSEDKKKWDQLEELRKRSQRTLTNKEQQQQYIHLLHLRSAPCWLCAKENTFYIAYGRARDANDYPRRFHCARCGVELKHSMPFLAAAGSWYWSRPTGVGPVEVFHHVEQWRRSLISGEVPTTGELDRGGGV